MVQMLLDKGAHANATTRQDGRTPLHEAAARGRLEVVQMLLGNGADFLARTDAGESPEGLATARGQTQVAALLGAVAEEADRRVRWGAFAMGQHQRLGARSLVQGLDADVAHIILNFGASYESMLGSGRDARSEDRLDWRAVLWMEAAATIQSPRWMVAIATVAAAVAVAMEWWLSGDGGPGW